MQLELFERTTNAGSTPTRQQLRHLSSYYMQHGPMYLHRPDAGLASVYRGDVHAPVLRFTQCRTCRRPSANQIIRFSVYINSPRDGLYAGRRYIQIQLGYSEVCRRCLDLGLHRYRNGYEGQIKRNVYAWLKALPCKDCGRTYTPEAMEFDHLPQFEKLADVSDLASGGSLVRFIDEIEKCDVVCAICHRIRTRDRHAADAEETEV